MNNLKQVRPDTFQYDDQPEGEVISVDVYYSAGGTGWMSGNSFPKGIYLSIMPVSIETRNGFTSRGFKLFGSKQESGAKMLLQTLPRKNAKALLKQAEAWDAYAPTLAAKFREDPSSPFAYARALLTPKAEAVA